MRWLKNSGGKPDAMLSFALGSFIICALGLVASILQGTIIKLGDSSFTFSSPDATIYAAFLGATFTSYVMRRNKKDDLEAKREDVE
jgi:NhaP-type Na+/H+ or K+/H+ antiporter